MHTNSFRLTKGNIMQISTIETGVNQALLTLNRGSK